MGTNCRNSVPPIAARKTELHGVSFISYPDPLPAKYTGCKVVWLEKNYVLSIAFFKDGVVEAARVWEPKHEAYSCFYESGILVASKSGSMCPMADNWR